MKKIKSTVSDMIQFLIKHGNLISKSYVLIKTNNPKIYKDFIGTLDKNEIEYYLSDSHINCFTPNETTSYWGKLDATELGNVLLKHIKDIEKIIICNNEIYDTTNISNGFFYEKVHYKNAINMFD